MLARRRPSSGSLWFCWGLPDLIFRRKLLGPQRPAPFVRSPIAQIGSLNHRQKARKRGSALILECLLTLSRVWGKRDRAWARGTWLPGRKL